MRFSADAPIAAAAASRPAVCAWPALAALLAIAAVVVAVTGADAARLDHRVALTATEPWRAWTAPLVHLSALHLAANVVGAVAIGALGWAAKLSWPFTLAWLVAWPLTQIGLLVRPDLERYAGLSGVLHAGAAIVAVALLADADGRRRAVGALLLAGIVAKVVLEAPWGEPLRQPAGWDIAIAPFAHAAGLVVGLVAGIVAVGWRLLLRRRR